MQLPQQQIEYPRKKQYLKNLNALLQRLENESVNYPFSLSARAPINNTNECRPKTMNMQRFTISDLNANCQNFKPINLGPGKILHSRSMSQCVRAGQTGQQQMIKTSQQLKKQKMVNMLSMQNVRKQLMHTRKLSAVQHRTRQIRSQQKEKSKKKQQNDLRFHLQLNKNYSSRQTSRIPNFKNQQQSQGTLLQQFNHIEREKNQIDSKTRMKSLQIRQSRSPKQGNKQIQRKQYLKKGTSINKSILNSIIRLKLTRNSATIQNLQSQSQKYIKNDQIVKMIKVYKGVDPIMSVVPKQINENGKRGRQLKDKDKDQLFIQGWQNETEQFDINNNGSQVNQAVHAVQSSQL